MSGLLRNMFEDNQDYESEVPFDEIPLAYLQDIISYCSHFNFEKLTANIPAPLPQNNLELVLNDPFEV